MRALVIALVLLGFIHEAAAHQTSVKYIDLVADGTRLEVTVRCAASDVIEPMGLAADAKPPVAAAATHRAVAPFVQRWLVLAGCTTTAPVARIADAKFLAVTWTATCADTASLELDLTAFFALDQRHEAVIRLSAPGAAPIETIARAAQPKLTLRAGQPPSLLAWLRTGMDHIYGGLDHVLFVITLLLVVMLYRGADTWLLRSFTQTLKSTALIITSFTVAHSITLIAAALGVVALDSQLVESLIALSIAYTAGEDIVRPDVRWRFALTFAFGLVHGLGFASVLAVLLPPTDVVVPLLVFNVGVELGQLSIVLVALPLIYALARALGAERYRRVMLPILAMAIGLVGAAMFAERVFEVRLLPM